MIKMRFKKILALAVSITSVLMLTSCKENLGTSEDSPQIEEVEVEEELQKYKFGFSGIDMSNPYFETLELVIREGLGNLEHSLITKDPKNNIDLQNEQLLSFIESEVDAVFVAPVDWVLIQESIDALNEAGIKVINIDTQIKDTSSIDVFIGSNNTDAGKKGGAEIVARYPDGGKVLLVECPTINSINNRITGFEETLSKNGFEIVSRFNGSGEREAAKIGVTNLIEQQPDITLVICGNDQMALGAYDAITELNMDVKVIGVDGTPEIKSLIQDGDEIVIGTIAQTPITIGKTAVSVAIDLLDGNEFNKNNYIDTFFISEDNISIYGTESWQ